MALPILGPNGSPIRPSKSGRWRALSLLLVHVLVLAHVLHWLSSGRTVSPVEPSESMETVRQGYINAGFIFFALAILVTAVLGRWVCGWGCHLVAYQDLTLWLLKKFRLRPKAYRTRFLVFVPLVAALYMFVWPAVYRLFVGAPNPPLTWHVTRTGFWDTFPDYGVAILTVLTCGVGIIYFLGPKGFCTFACPYGAFFGAVDKLAVARIRVTDACNQCGHCTAVCTSNVDVANEVKLHKMVVDPGCMKCLDCVSVCPNDALYFGLGRPSFGISPKRSARRYDLSLVEELAALVLGFGAFLAYRGLYGKSPFLMSLGCAGIATYLLMKAASLFYRHDVVLQKNVLKSDGRIQKAGWVVLFPTILLLAFTAHSGAVQYQAYLGKRVLAGLPTEYFGWQRNREGLQLRGQDREAAAAARAHFAFCEKWGLLATLENEQRLAWLDLLGGHINEALQRVRQIAASHPDYALDWVKLGNFETFAGHREEAGKAYQRAMEIDRGPRERIAAKHPDEQFPLSAQAYAEWGLFLADDGATDRAQEALEKSVKLDRTSAMAWMALGGFQLGSGQIDRARQSLLQACLLEPHALPPLEMVERIGRADQDFAAALRDYDEVAGKQFVFRYNRAHALVRLRRYDEAIAAYRKLVEEQPGLVEIRADLGAVLLATSDLNGAIGQFEIVATALPSDSEAHFKLGYLYHQVGRGADAAREYQTAIRLGGPGKDLAEQGLKALNSEGGR